MTAIHWRMHTPSPCTLSFDSLKSPLLKKCFSELSLYESVTSSDLVAQLKLKFLLMKSTHDDIIEAKEVTTNCILKAFAQADLRLSWSHIPHCWKFHVTAHI